MRTAEVDAFEWYPIGIPERMDPEVPSTCVAANELFEAHPPLYV
jgi:hypothetical protein